MSTVGGATRKLVADSGLVNQRIWRDRAPDQPTFPYVTFVDPLSLTPRVSGDGRTTFRSRQSSWDLWQKANEESDALLADLCALLDGAEVDTGDGRKTFRLKLDSVSRVTDPDRQVVHHALTLSLAHEGF